MLLESDVLMCFWYILMLNSAVFLLFETILRCVCSCLCMISLEIAKQAGTRDEPNVCSLLIRKCYWYVSSTPWLGVIQNSAVCLFTNKNVPSLACSSWLKPNTEKKAVQLCNSMLCSLQGLYNRAILGLWKVKCLSALAVQRSRHKWKRKRCLQQCERCDWAPYPEVRTFLTHM